MNNDFPIEVFHSEIQRTVKEYNRVYKSDINAICSHILVSMAFPLNNLYEVKPKRYWTIRPNLWLIHLAQSGTGKSKILETINKSVMLKQSEIHKSYRKRKAEYDEYNGHDLPRFQTLYVSSFTPEGMHKILSTSCNNGKAVLILNDEISGNLNSLNQYSKGSGEEDLLTYYDYLPKFKARAGLENMLSIDEINVSLIGCTQPRNIYSILNPDKLDNGAAFRFLYFDEPDNGIIKNPFEENVNDSDFMNGFYEMINYFLSDVENMELNRTELFIPDECKKLAETWYNNFLQSDLDIDRTILENIMGKMTGYVYKFAIALNRTKYYFDKLLDDTLTDTYFINIFDMNNSLILAEYYINNSIKILNKVINPSDKIFNSEIEKEIYKNLPETFQSSNFIGEYKRNNISIATAKRRLTNYQNSKIVGKNRQGEYYKIIAA